MIDETSLREFYEFVYPVDLVVQWLSYNLQHADKIISSPPGSVANGNDPKVLPSTGEDVTEGGRGSTSSADGYLARREFCFTLLGDIFTRFRSYSSVTELRRELIRSFPEKIDVGAVYNIRPNQKQKVGTIVPVERELVFDIDMSDYDNSRSCCTGKSICRWCWTWMSCAAAVLRKVLEDDFGFRYLFPVFSGRRGIHLWVCDKRACKMHDDERSALVSYLTVVVPKASQHAVVADFVNGKPIHPTIQHVQATVLDPAFTSLFLNSTPENPNRVTHPKGARIVYKAIVSALKMGTRRDVEQRFLRNVPFEEGNILDWTYVLRTLGDAATNVIAAAQILLMYPRLDEHVSTRRDHLLKLPFCVHPATGSLCCPLEWDNVPTFDPVSDPPKLQDMLLHRHMDEKWLAPLQRMLQEMGRDPAEER
ncbi:DNA primase small subunit, putative [Trypanosoma equiperdum]|uniref:DNA primase n=2 Tax=Trypanozoon TaxID=39700 RepID=Q57XP3_TRYB2|nr:DNA primase small subunit, putative [Trypanosoma brucei brucei TREU927]AAX69626.1 DNA primase small subunit, putative [Trypanosoma brucei]AAZ12295.1 DNA primase small subunit, putative [Trypanosoma brucei brucei TREU927]SCU72865.1 DNA primase small subunit, putative [Trypanosoma equiperdum]